MAKTARTWIGVSLFILGIMSADSENLIIPIVLIAIGTLMGRGLAK